MPRSDDAIIYWGQNVTLRRFLTVSSVILSWIACDLALQSLSCANINGHDGWKMALSVTGISLFRWYAALEWLGVVEPALATRVLVVLHGVFSTLLLYFVAMWRLSRPLVQV